jgi:hypothetical protein
MGGDHAGGLTLLIGGVMLVIAVGSIFVAWLAGWGVARLCGAAPKTRKMAGLVGALLGGVFAMATIVSTFFVGIMSPPVLLELRVPAGFAQSSVMLIEDPTISDTLQGSGGGLPFTRRHVTVDVPASGVLRMADFGPLLRNGHAPEIRMSNDPGRHYYADLNPPPNDGRATQLLYIVSVDAPYDTRFGVQEPAVSTRMIHERTGK